MFWLGILLGIPIGVLVVIGWSVLVAASESYTGPMAPDDRERGALS